MQYSGFFLYVHVLSPREISLIQIFQDVCKGCVLLYSHVTRRLTNSEGDSADFPDGSVCQSKSL